MIGKSIFIIYAALVLFVRCDFDSCLKNHCSNSNTKDSIITCYNVTSLSNFKFENNSKCFDKIHSASIHFQNGTNVIDLGILNQFKKLYFLKLFNITNIDNGLFSEIKTLEYVFFNNFINIKGEKLSGNWRIIETANNMWLKICGNAVEHYQLPHFSHIVSYNETKFVLERGTDENTSDLDTYLSRQVNGIANFISCVDKYCTRNLFSPIFQCPEQYVKHFSLSKLPNKYQTCLSNVTHLMIPRLVPEILEGFLDFFKSVVKITFLGDAQIYIDSCAFIPLKHLRILDFGKSIVNYNEILTILDNLESPILITHENYSLYRRCDEVKRYTYKGHTIRQQMNQLDPDRVPKCNNFNYYLLYISIVFFIIIFISVFVIYKLTITNCNNKFV